MINGTSTLSLRKQDLENQKIPAIGFQKIMAAHQCAGGESQINLTALTIPPTMASNGFSQPTTAQLTNAQILFYPRNVTITSSVRTMQFDKDYKISSSTVITFIGFTASVNEIFTITIDYTAMTGIKVVDARPINANGTLTANTTDFNVGVPFKTGQYITGQIGGVIVFRDETLQYRNTGNSSTVLDGNYYEVDAGAGLGTLIRFNTTDSVDNNVAVISNGLLSERPDGSMMATIESIQGQVNNMAVYLAAVAGQTPTTVLGAAPTNQDLKAFGDRVFALEGNRARIDLGNAWTAPQALVGVTDGSSAAAGVIREVIRSSVLRSSQISLTSNTPVTITSIILSPGIWHITGAVGYKGGTGSSYTYLAPCISKTTNAETSSSFFANPVAGEINMGATFPSMALGSADRTVTIPGYIYNFSGASVTLYLTTNQLFSGGTFAGYGFIEAVRIG